MGGVGAEHREMAGSWPAPTPSRPGRPLPWPRPHSPPLSGENEGKPPFLRRGSEKGSVARTAESSFRVLCPGATTVRPTTPSPSAPAPGHSWREVTQQLLAPPQPHNSTAGPRPPPQLGLSHLELVLVPLPEHPPASPPAIPTQPRNPISPPSPQTSQTLPQSELTAALLLSSHPHGWHSIPSA